MTTALIQLGADINAKDNNGDTPIHLACEKGRMEVFKKLLASGADTKVIDNNGKNHCIMHV